MYIPIYIKYIHNVNIDNSYMHNMYILILLILIILILLVLISICTSFYFLLLLELIYCSRFCCFTAPIAMPNNDNTLIYVNHTQLTYIKTKT